MALLCIYIIRSSFRLILALIHPPTWPLGTFTLITWSLHITWRSESRHPRQTHSGRECLCSWVRLGAMYARWLRFSATWCSGDTTQVPSSGFPMELALLGTDLSLQCGQLWTALDTALDTALLSMQAIASVSVQLLPWLSVNPGTMAKCSVHSVHPNSPRDPVCSGPVTDFASLRAVIILDLP